MFAHNFFETVNNILNINVVVFFWSLPSVNSLSAGIAKSDVHILFKALFGKNFINCITEVSPSDMLSFFWRFESLTKQLKFRGRNLNFGHA